MPRLPRAGVVLVLVWALVSAAVHWRSAAARGPDPVAELDAEFQALSRAASSAGPIGYLEPYDDPDRADNLLVYYVAQYAFAPRLVLRRTDLDLLVVPEGAARPDGDERLAGFEPVAGSPGGHRLDRRRTP